MPERALALVEKLWCWLQSPQVWSWVGLYVCAVVGAFLLYAFQRNQNKQPFSMGVAININVGNAASWVILLDMLVSSMILALAVTLITSPQRLLKLLWRGWAQLPQH